MVINIIAWVNLINIPDSDNWIIFRKLCYKIQLFSTPRSLTYIITAACTITNFHTINPIISFNPKVEFCVLLHVNFAYLFTTRVCVDNPVLEFGVANATVLKRMPFHLGSFTIKRKCHLKCFQLNLESRYLVRLPFVKRVHVVRESGAVLLLKCTLPSVE